MKFAVWEASDSRHNGGLIIGPPKTHQYDLVFPVIRNILPKKFPTKKIVVESFPCGQFSVWGVFHVGNSCVCNIFVGNFLVGIYHRSVFPSWLCKHETSAQSLSIFFPRIEITNLKFAGRCFQAGNIANI